MNRIFLAVFLCCFPSLAINLIYKMPGYSTVLAKKEAAIVDDLVNTYEWPSSVDLMSTTSGNIKQKAANDFAVLTARAKGAETKFLQTFLSGVSSRLTASFMPQTLWDLVALAYEYEKAEGYFGLAKRQKITQYFFDSAKKLSGAPLIDFTNATATNKFLIFILNKFRGKTDSFIFLYDDRLPKAFIAEIAKVKDGTSSIMNSIQQEINANKHNDVLFFRGSNGIALNSSREEFALDFVVPSEENVMPTVSGIARNIGTLIRNKNAKSIDLSFQYSLLGGCGGDEGICPYYYFTEKNTSVIYALSLSRDFALKRGKQLFFMPSIRADGLVDSEGILGHPRLRLIGPFRFRFDEIQGGKIFKFGFYRPIDDPVLNTIPNAGDRKYLSFLTEASTLIRNSSIKIATQKDVNWAALKANQRIAHDILKQNISAIAKALTK